MQQTRVKTINEAEDNQTKLHARLGLQQTLTMNDADTTNIQPEEEENAIVYRLLNGPPLWSDDRLSQLWVLRDRRNPRRCQFVPVATHFIMDAMAGATITRELLQELSLSAPSSATLPPLGDRLETILSVEDLFPSRSMSTPRKRWRKAIATVILSLRKKTLTVNLHITFAQETQLIRLG